MNNCVVKISRQVMFVQMLNVTMQKPKEVTPPRIDTMSLRSCSHICLRNVQLNLPNKSHTGFVGVFRPQIDSKGLEYLLIVVIYALQGELVRKGSETDQV